MTRLQVRTNIRSNLQDFGITYYDDQSINDAIQDAYNEVASKCFCIVNSVTVNQIANNPYYDFQNQCGVTDYIGTIAIYNLNTMFWLRDDVSLRDYDRLRRDWERWTGAPQFWTPHSLQYVAITPNLAQTSGEQFTLWYWGQAPTLQFDTDTFLIASDMQNLLEWYGTADKLEDAQETAKAAPFWQMYEEDKMKYRARCLELARADLLLRV